MTEVKRMVLDVLKPSQLTMIELSSAINGLKNVGEVEVSSIEMDREVENVKIEILGEDLDYETIKQEIEDQGASVHSLDEVKTAK